MQWLMLFVTFVVIAVLHRLARGAPVEAQATLALGSLVLLAYVLGTIARRFRIPRIVAYLLAGLIASPSWRELVSDQALARLDPITHGALFLIAFAIGNALTIDMFRGERRTAVLRIGGAAMVAPFLTVVLVVLSVSPWFPLTAHQPFRDALVVALALGTVAAVSSPILAWPVIQDAGADGPLPRTVLDVSVLQDLVAAVLVVLVLALAYALGSPGTVTPGSATHAVVLGAGSIVAGVTLAAVATQYLRVIQHRLTWVLVILAFVVSQLVRLLTLDAVLIGLAAGVALRALAADHSARVRSELERCAIPVYVVFFSLAGANLQLDVLSEIWPWILLLAGLRMTGLWAGMQWAAGWRGGRGERGWRGHPSVSPAWADYGWLGLVSQGGFAITLAALFRRAFPEWNVSLEALIVALIGVHQLAGPISFHWILRRTGVPPREGHDRPMLGTAENAAPGSPMLIPTGGNRVP